MAARILHLSDLHLGRREAPEPIAALRSLASELAPGLLVATGDLSHRGKRAQLERAADVMRSVGVPFVAVPGNHDIPYTFPARFTRPFAEWERAFGTVEPVHSSDDVVLLGLNSVRPWRQQGGALGRRALERVAAALRTAPRGALRVVALHHHLAAPPWRAGRKRPVRRRGDVLRSFADAGVELVLSGHVHQAAVAERREFEALEGRAGGSLVLATAPGLGRPRPRRRGETLGFNLYEVDERSLAVATYTWDGSAFGEVGRRSFPRSPRPYGGSAGAPGG